MSSLTSWQQSAWSPADAKDSGKERLITTTTTAAAAYDDRDVLRKPQSDSSRDSSLAETTTDPSSDFSVRGTGRRAKVSRPTTNSSVFTPSTSAASSLSSDKGDPWQSTPPELSASGHSSNGTFSSQSSSPITPKKLSSGTSSWPTPPTVLSRRSSSPRLGGAKIMPAKERPLYQHDRSTSSGSSENSALGLSSLRTSQIRNGQLGDSLMTGQSIEATTTMSPVSPPLSASTPTSSTTNARRQLMPSIPTRRTSAANDGSGASGSPNTGNQSNIQSLAQAIAARAQQVAATKAAAAAAQQKAREALTAQGNGKALAPTTRGPVLGGALTAVLNRDERVLSIADTIASDYGDVESDPEDAGEPAKKRDADKLRSDRADVAQSFRWSQGDWADYAAALSQQIDVGSSASTGSASQPNEGVFVAAPSFAALAARKSIHDAELPTITFPATEPASLHGLGIQETPAAVSLTDDSVRQTDFSSPLFANLANKEKANSAAPVPSLDSADNLSPSTTTGSPPVRRKGRPTPLKLSNANNPHSPSGSLTMSPSASRSLASPSTARTPPPTMPPTEPLPPLPAETSSGIALRRILSPDGSSSAPRSRQASNQSGINEAWTFHNSSSNSKEQRNSDRKRSSDPSNSRSAFPSSNSTNNVEGGFSSVDVLSSRKMSLPHTSLSTASLAAQSAALVEANRASIVAETEKANVMLDQMKREPTFDQSKRRSNTNASTGPTESRRTSSSIQSSSSHSKDAAKMALSERLDDNSQEELRDVSDSKEADIDDDLAEEDEEAEEAVVTRVTTTAKGARASLSRAPSLVRRGSDMSIVSSRPQSNGSPAANGAGSFAQRSGDADQVSTSTVNRIRAKIEAQSNPIPRDEKRATVSNLSNAGGGESMADKGALIRENAPTATPQTQQSADIKSNVDVPGAKAVKGTRKLPVTNNGDAPPSAWPGTSVSGVVATGRPSLNLASQPQRVTVSSAGSVVGDGTIIARSPSASSLHGQMGSWTPTLGTPSVTGGYEHPNGPLDSAGDASNLSSSTTQGRPSSGLQSRRSEMTEDSYTPNGSPVERIKRTEGRFAGAFGEVALAFKQLQAEKRALEKIVRATTPLDGLGTNGESLGEYLTSIHEKVEASAQEIRKLLDLLDQQRSVMDYMGDTHRLELEALNDEMEDLRDDFDAVCEEADTHRDNCIRLTEDLDKAQHDAIDARAETLRYKATLQEEEGRKGKMMKLLRMARNDLARLEKERDDAREALQSPSKSIVKELASSTEAGSVSGDVSVDRSTLNSAMSGQHDSGAEQESLGSTVANSALLERVSSLERELRQARDSNVDMQSRLSNYHQQQSALLNGAYPSSSQVESPTAASHSATAPSLSDGIDDGERERDLLREKLFQQEKDIAELRAQIALGAVVGSAADGGLPSPTSSGSMPAGLPAAREDQIKLLMAQMTEQRAREAQIRKAYRQVRDELRKMHSAQQHDRRRMSFLSHNQPGPGALSTLNSASSLSSSVAQALGSTTASGPLPSHPRIEGALGLTQDGKEDVGPTPRHLKRLSLPLVNKLAPPALGSASAVTSIDDEMTTSASRPVSLLATGGGKAPIFSSNRRGSRTFSVDFTAPSNRLRAPRSTYASSDASSSTDVSPRMQTHMKLFGNADAVSSAKGVRATSTAGVEDEEGMEHLRTPRQSILHDTA